MEDLAGNRSESSPARTIAVVTAAPQTRVVSATLSDDTGVSDSDNVTTVAQQTVTGELNEALSAGQRLLASLDGGVSFADITYTVDGASFVWSNVTLSQGQGVLSWVVVDASGVPGTTWDLAYTLESGAPADDSVLDPAWEVNTSRLTIDFSATPKAGWISPDDHANNDWDENEGSSYRTDNDDVFGYEFGRVFWSVEDSRWEHETWQLGVGDRIRGATLLDGFDGTQAVKVPDSFGSVAGGDDQVDNGQFEVYYGTYVNGVFQITSTEEFGNALTDRGGATHTLIMFDNDTQNRSSNTLNDMLAADPASSYLPDGSYAPAYSGAEVRLSDPYWLEAAVVEGVFHESGWDLTTGSDGGQLLSWAPSGSYISVGRLDADASAFGAWFDTNEDGVKDTDEQQVQIEILPDWGNQAYYYTLEGVDFANEAYTVRFVDIVFGNFDTPEAGSLTPGVSDDSYSPYNIIGLSLDLGGQGFGWDDQLIVDMRTNGADWMGQSDHGALAGVGAPTAAVVGSAPDIQPALESWTLDANIGDAVAAAALLTVGTAPEDEQSRTPYAELAVFGDPHGASYSLQAHVSKYDVDNGVMHRQSNTLVLLGLTPDGDRHPLENVVFMV